MEVEDINVDVILLNKKSFENNLFYNILWMQNHCILGSIK